MTTKAMRNLVIFAFLFATLGCEKSENREPVDIPTGEHLILVGNEGGFGAGNASLSLIDTKESAVFQNVYANANNSAALGDILNSISEFGNEIFLVMNNSEKIEVVQSSDFTFSKTISISGGTPRYISFLSPQLAYVSDLYDTGIHLVNPTSGSYEGFVNLSNSVEHMLIVGDELWAGESFDVDFNPGDEIIILDTGTNQETGSIQLSAGVNKMVRDADGKVWVLCNGDGNSSPVIPSKLYRINPSSKSIEASWELPELTGYVPVSIAASVDGQFIYYVMQGDIYRMELSASELPENAFIEPGLSTLYTIHCDERTGQIALTDVKDYSQDGSVQIYDSKGSEIGTYTTDIIPNAVHWMDN